MKFHSLLLGFLAGFTALTVAQNPPTPATTSTPASAPATTAPTEDAALIELRNTHQAAVKAKLDAISRKEIDTLKALEKSRAEHGDYTGAQAAVEKINALEKTVGITSDPLNPSFILDFQVHHSLALGIVLKNKNFVITKGNGMIRWDGLNVKPGSYQVKMTYSVGDPDVVGTVEKPILRTPKSRGDGTMIPVPAYGGTIVFQEETSINASPAIKKRIPPTISLIPEQTEVLGTIQISSNRTALTLKATDAEVEGLMFLKQIELVPIVPMSAAAGTEPKEYKLLHDEYRKTIMERTGSAHRYWYTKLVELEKQCTEIDNVETLALIKPELARVQTIVSPPSDTVAGIRKPVVISAPDPIMATYIGEIRLSPTKDSLQRLRPERARVSFKLAAAKVVPGKYSITLQTVLGPNMGGEYKLTCLGNTVKGTIEPTQGTVKRSVEVPSPIIIPPNAAYLDLEVVSLNSSTGSLCELRAISLTPTE